MPEPCFHSRSTSKNRIGIKTRPQMRNASHNAETLGGEFHGRPPGHGSRPSHGRRANDCALGLGTVKSCRSSWPMSTLNFPTPPFCKRKPNAKPKIAPAISFGAAATGGAGFSVDCCAAFPGSIMVPHSLKRSMATAIPPTKKQTTTIHNAILS